MRVTDQTETSRSPRTLLLPAEVPSAIGYSWHSGLVASSAVISLSLIVERSQLEELPLGPQIGITSASGEPLLGLIAGVENLHRGVLAVCRQEKWDPIRFPRACQLRVSAPSLSIQYVADFVIE